MSAGLSPKWRLAGRTLTKKHSALVTRYTPSTTDVLALCARLAPCVLVVESAAIATFNPDEFRYIVGSVQVLVECGEIDVAEAERLIRLGCAGLIHSAATPSNACGAVLAVQRGELWITRAMASELIRSLLRDSRLNLTVRETEILGLLGEGLKNTEIAERLFISPLTVRWHLRSLYGKLGTHDRARAATTTSRYSRNTELERRQRPESDSFMRTPILSH